MSDLSAIAADWLNRGRALEARGTPAALATALRCYDEAIGLLRKPSPDASSQTRRDLAIAWMNRGNVLLKQATATSLAAAVNAYDETITLLGISFFENDFAVRNSLGAAWMNRGLTLHRRASEENLEEAVRSHREAIAVLQPLSSDENPRARRNLAAAWMNLANVLLDSSPPDRFASAADAARSALVLVASGETFDPIAADLSLKARRCLCDALGHQLSANEAAGISNQATASEVSETVDAALALIRHWERRGAQNFRPLAERFFRLGAHFYRLHQPHFLAEFVLENLDAQQSEGAITGRRELYAIAEDAISAALRTLRVPRLINADDPAITRQLETSRDLQAAEQRLATLRNTYFPSG